MAKKTFNPIPVKHGDKNYEIVIPSIQIGKKIHTAEEIAENDELIDRLITNAWGADEHARDEENFHKNGIFHIVHKKATAKVTNKGEKK